MSAAQRLKAQEKQSRRFDRAVNKKFKQMKKAWKKKIAGKVVKGVAFVATAAAAGAVAGKVKEIVKTKSGDELREMATKIKIKFEEKRAAKKSAADAVKTGADLGAGAANMDGVTAAAAANEAGEKMPGAVNVGTDTDGVTAAAAANEAGEKMPETVDVGLNTDESAAAAVDAEKEIQAKVSNSADSAAK